jgi:hypothetical protein
MARILLWGVLALLVLGGFYVAWPAWTGRQIGRAFEANDPAMLERYIDFPSVRERAKPILAAEVDRSLDRLKQGSSRIGGIADQLRERLGGRLTDAAVDTILTPENLVAIVRQGRSLRRVMREAAGSRNGAGEQPSRTEGDTGDQPNQGPAGQPRRFGLANIKSYRITGPLSISVGVSRDAEAPGPDVIAELAFTSGGWKVVGIVPQF